jgi:hypothetical protein
MNMSTMGQGITASIGERLASKMRDKVGYRADLHVSDYACVNRATAKVLIGYASHLGKPDSQQLEQFVLKRFEGQVVADIRTARNIPSHSVVECVLAFPAHTLPIEAKDTMTALAGDMAFMDHKFGTVWEVQEAEGGGKELVRKRDDDIASILDARQRSMRSHAGMVSLADLADARGELQVSVGQTVRYYSDNREKKGVVASIGTGIVRIRPVGNESRPETVAMESILSVEKVSAAEDKASNAALRDFYLQFMSVDLVDQLYPAGGGTPKFESDKPREQRA